MTTQTRSCIVGERSRPGGRSRRGWRSRVGRERARDASRPGTRHHGRWDRFMERSTGLRNPPGRTGILEPARPVRRRSMAPHHRRRRAAAILTLVVLGGLGVALLAVGGRTHAPRAATLAEHAFFGRI